MSNRRFFCDVIPDPGDIAILNDNESHHVLTVLRGQPGDPIILMDGAGITAVAKIHRFNGGLTRPRVQCRIIEVNHHSPPGLRFMLYITPPRTKRMRRIVSDAVQLGVTEIVPVFTERKVAQPGPGVISKWKADTREACKQSGNPFLPLIQSPISFHEALTRSSQPGFVGCPPDQFPVTREENRRLIAESFEMMRQLQNKSIELWIGPEGGLTDKERQALFDAGLLPLNIGTYTLRVETAVTACIAWLVRSMEDQ